MISEEAMSECERYPKILLIEDEPEPAEGIWNLTADFLPPVVQWAQAQSLTEAFCMLKENIFQIIISDLMLPDSQGLETIRLVHEMAPGIPLIVFSGDPILLYESQVSRFRDQTYRIFIKGQTAERDFLEAIQSLVVRLI